MGAAPSRWVRVVTAPCAQVEGGLIAVAGGPAGAFVAVYGASIPWGRVHADGATVVPARQLADLLQALPPILGPERVSGWPGWPTEPACGSTPPPDSQHTSARSKPNSCLPGR
jgi:hypothetical protein